MTEQKSSIQYHTQQRHSRLDNLVASSDGLSEIANIRQSLSRHGFDLFRDPVFMEWYITMILGGTQTKHHAHADCILPDGTRVEIKNSNIISKTQAKGGRHYEFEHFLWSRLRGCRHSKDGCVDYIILVGYSKDSGLMIWVVPYSVLPASEISYQISPRKNSNYNRINSFFVGNEKGLARYFEDLKNGR